MASYDPFRNISGRYSSTVTPPTPSVVAPTATATSGESLELKGHRRTKVIVIVICVVTVVILLGVLIFIIVSQHNKSTIFKPYKRGPLPGQVGDPVYIGGTKNTSGVPLAKAPSKPTDPNVAVFGQEGQVDLTDAKKSAVQRQVDFMKTHPNGCLSSDPNDCTY